MKIFKRLRCWLSFGHTYWHDWDEKTTLCSICGKSLFSEEEILRIQKEIEADLQRAYDKVLEKIIHGRK
jgi:hypothetical protein